MSDVKALLFIKPYSETVEQLKKVCEEISEDENISINEIENLAEIAPILVQYGPSLLVYASPKKCALSLQGSRRIFKRLFCKTMLLTPREIPRKTMDKFHKYGLTEFIQEPIAPKSLLYKIKLMLRALPVLHDEEEDFTTFKKETGKKKKAEEIEVKRGEDEQKETEKNMEIAESDTVAEEIGPPQPKKLNEVVRPDEEAETESEEIGRGPRPKRNEEEERTRSSYKEKSISGHLTGKVETFDDNSPEDPLAIDEELDIGGDVIDSYYKGKQTGELDKIENEDLVGEGKVDKLTDVEMGELKQGIQLDVEEGPAETETSEQENPLDLLRTKAITPQLDVEEEEESEEEANPDIIEGHLKGKVGTEQLDVDDDTGLETRERTTQDASPQNLLGKINTKKLSVEDDNLLDFTEMDKIAAAVEKDDVPRQKLEVEDGPNENDEQEESVEKVDAYMRSKAAQKKLEVQEEKSMAVKSLVDKSKNQKEGTQTNSMQLKVLDDKKDQEDEDPSPIERLKQLQKKKDKLTALKIEQDEQKKELDPKEGYVQEPFRKLTKTAQLEVEEEMDVKTIEKKEEQNTHQIGKLKRPQELNVEDEKEEEEVQAEMAIELEAIKKKAEALEVEEDLGEFKNIGEMGHSLTKKLKKETEKLSVEDDEKRRENSQEIDNEIQKVKAAKKGLKVDKDSDDYDSNLRKVDYIEKYYGTKKKEWDDPEQKKKVSFPKRNPEEEEKKKKKFEKQIKIANKEREEQTIDYSQLKKEYDELSDWTPGKKKKQEDEYGSEKTDEKDAGDLYAEGSRNKKGGPSYEGGGKDGKAEKLFSELGKNKSQNELGPKLTHPEAISLANGQVEVEEEEEEALPVIEPDSRGLEDVIRSLDIYEDKEKSDNDILEFIVRTIKEKHSGVTTFFMIDKESGLNEERYSGHLRFGLQKTEQAEEGEDDEKKEEESKETKSIDEFAPGDNESWTKYLNEKKSEWEETTLPTWSDSTFQNDRICFVYPYFEGEGKMGTAIVDFKDGMDQLRTARIEVLLESARGPYLENFHRAGLEGKYEKNKDGDKKKKGLGRFFGRKAS